MEIHLANPTHYEGIATVYNALYPQNTMTAADIADNEKRRDPKFKYQRWVAIAGEQVVGVGLHNQSIWFAHPQKFTLWIGVLPSHQGCGYGAALYDAIIKGLHSYHPIALRVTITGDCSQSIRFLEKRGFNEVIRDVRSELAVSTFDLTRFTGLEDRFRANGIEIKTLPELEKDPERNQKLYDLDWELSMDVPGDLAAGMGRRRLDKYIEYAITGPFALPEGFFVAVKGDEFIGLSHVLLSQKDTILFQGLTGVKSPYRRQGIGLALKVRVIKYARIAGYTIIKAENDAQNSPMLAMNERLGYVRHSDLITFEKQLQQAEGA